MNDRTHQRENLVLEQRLRAHPPQFSTAPGFTERVMDSLPARLESRSHRSATRISWLRLLIGLAATACLAFAAIRFLPAKSSPEIQVVQSAPLEVPEIKIPEITVAQLEAWTARLDEPLERELKNVISDTRQAIQFIASNFLPEN